MPTLKQARATERAVAKTNAASTDDRLSNLRKIEKALNQLADQLDAELRKPVPPPPPIVLKAEPMSSSDARKLSQGVVSLELAHTRREQRSAIRFALAEARRVAESPLRTMIKNAEILMGRHLQEAFKLGALTSVADDPTVHTALETPDVGPNLGWGSRTSRRDDHVYWAVRSLPNLGFQKGGLSEGHSRHNDICVIVALIRQEIAKTSQTGTANLTVSIDIETIQATITTTKTTETIDLPSEGVARWLKVLVDHPMAWFFPEKYKDIDADLDGVKPTDRLRSLKTKCPMLASLIEPSTRNGMRFNPSLRGNLKRSPQVAGK